MEAIIRLASRYPSNIKGKSTRSKVIPTTRLHNLFQNKVAARLLRTAVVASHNVVQRDPSRSPTSQPQTSSRPSCRPCHLVLSNTAHKNGRGNTHCDDRVSRYSPVRDCCCCETDMCLRLSPTLLAVCPGRGRGYMTTCRLRALALIVEDPPTWYGACP